jgi:hypothetical protein
MDLKLRKVRQAIEDGFYDVNDLVLLVEMTVEDVIERFEDRLCEHAEKFGIYEEEEQETVPEGQTGEEEEPQLDDLLDEGE